MSDATGVGPAGGDRPPGEQGPAAGASPPGEQGPAAANPGEQAPAAAGASPGEQTPPAPSPEASAAAPAADFASPDAPTQPSTAPEAPEPSRPANLHGCPVDPHAAVTVVHCNRSDYLPLMSALKEEGYELPVGVTGVDYLTHPGRDLPASINPERFEVVVELLSLKLRQRVRVRCQVPAGDPAVPTLYQLWPGTEAHERETYDMFGIGFDGHPDPSRILMPEDWEGHPLRKDYDTGHIPVQFKEAP